MEWTIDPVPNENGSMLATLRGDMDLYEAPRVAEALLACVGGGARRLLVDMSGVEYLDSTGVGVIIRLTQFCKSKGGNLQFRGIHGSPRTVLVMSNVIRLVAEADAPADGARQ